MRWCLILGVVVLTGSSAQAERVALRGEALKQALAGKTVHLDTPFGVAIPITFHGNGLMSGKAGVLQYFLGAEADRGRWWVAEGKLCQKWFKWLDAQPSCMSLQQDGPRIFWQRNDGLSGTATIEAGLPPGADSRPRALGGPTQPPEIRHSLMATEPHDGATREKTPIRTESLHSTVPGPESKVSRAAIPEVPHEYGRLTRDLSTIASGLEYDWCHSAPVERTAPAAAPSLAFVAHLLYAGIEMGRPANACFTAKPALATIARLAVEAR
jgi:hypothetical protein